MTRYAELFWHSPLGDAQYKALLENG